MRVYWFISLRFMWEQRFQNMLIVTGVGVGVAVLVFISALMTGLQASLIEKTTGSQPHVVVTPLEREGRPLLAAEVPTWYLRRIERPVQKLQTLPEWKKLDRTIGGMSGVRATAPIATGPALAVRGATERGVTVLGADADRMERVVPIAKNIRAGTYAVAGTDIVIGVALAEELGVGVGDRVRLKTATGEGQLFIVRGLVDMGNQALNQTWVLMSLRNAQTLLGLGGAATAIYAKVSVLFEAELLARRIANVTGLTSESWMATNAQLLSALKSQTASTTMIRFFVLVTVAIGIASVLIVSIIQRSREIGILRAMGVSRGGIGVVFVLQGGLIGLAGSIIGVALGAGLSLIFQAALRDASGAPLFQFALTPGLFMSAAAIALVAGVAAALLPARRAARLDPAEAISHG